MATIDEITLSAIERFNELMSEAETILGALEALVPQDTPAPAKRTRKEKVKAEPKGKPKGRPPGSGRQNRKDQVIIILSGRSGQTVPELAEQMGIQPNYLYRVLPSIASKDAESRWSLKPGKYAVKDDSGSVTTITAGGQE